MTWQLDVGMGYTDDMVFLKQTYLVVESSGIKKAALNSEISKVCSTETVNGTTANA